MEILSWQFFWQDLVPAIREQLFHIAHQFWIFIWIFPRKKITFFFTALYVGTQVQHPEKPAPFPPSTLPLLPLCIQNPSQNSNTTWREIILVMRCAFLTKPSFCSLWSSRDCDPNHQILSATECAAASIPEGHISHPFPTTILGSVISKTWPSSWKHISHCISVQAS